MRDSPAFFTPKKMAGHWQHRVLLALRHWPGRAILGGVVFDGSLGIDPGTVQRESSNWVLGFVLGFRIGKKMEER